MLLIQHSSASLVGNVRLSSEYLLNSPLRSAINNEARISHDDCGRRIYTILVAWWPRISRPRSTCTKPQYTRRHCHKTFQLFLDSYSSRQRVADQMADDPSVCISSLCRLSSTSRHSLNARNLPMSVHEHQLHKTHHQLDVVFLQQK